MITVNRRRGFALSVLASLASMFLFTQNASALTEQLVNRTFAAGNVHEWELCDPAVNSPPTTTGPIPCNFSGAVTTGTWSVDNSDHCSAGADNYSANLQPNTNANMALRQRLIVGELVGRTVTISGCWKRSSSPSGADRKIKVTVAWKKERGAGGSGTYDTSCTWTAPSSTTTWVTSATGFSFSCSFPGVGSTKMWADAYLQVETVGTKGDIRLDDLSASAAGSPATWSISCTAPLSNCRGTETLSSISSSKEIVAVSNRWNVTGKDGFLIREVSATDANGGNVIQVTQQPSGAEYGQIHPAVSPDRTKVAVVRFLEDWNADGKHQTTVDPQSVWILDLSSGYAYQLSPYWQDAGLAGFAWSTDSQYVYYSTEIGPYTRIYKVKYDGTSSTLMSDYSLNDWESDVDLSRDGSYLIFHVAQREIDGTFKRKGKIYAQSASEGPCGPCSTRVQLTDSPDSEQYFPTSVPLPVGDYDAQFSPNGTQILFWRNRVCNSPSCNSAMSGWSIEICTVSTGCTNNANVTRLLDGGVGDTADNVFLIPDWVNAGNVPANTLPIIVGNNDQRTGSKYFGIFALKADGTSQTKLQGSSCKQDSPPTPDTDECDVWPRWIDR